MKSNRIMWGLVALAVLTTIAITMGTSDSHSQQKPVNQSQNTSNATNDNGYDDLSKYAVVDYEAPMPKNAKEREERKVKNGRYDGQNWVVKTPHPDDSGVGRYDEIPAPPAIPLAESSFVLLGEVVNITAYLSNDKRSVYTEFTFCIEEALKARAADKVVKGGCITVDREGGYVQYPNGQKVLYRISGKDLPGVGSHYVLFLTTDKQSPNYEILTGYELKGNNVSPLDRGVHFEKFRGAGEMDFIRTVRDSISRPSQPANVQ